MGVITFNSVVCPYFARVVQFRLTPDSFSSSCPQHLTLTVFVQNLYDMLLGLLEERGIDGPFVQQLIDYATTYEHTQYVNFLESLRDFANAK